jgi:hypothetical protein
LPGAQSATLSFDLPQRAFRCSDRGQYMHLMSPCPGVKKLPVRFLVGRDFEQIWLFRILPPVVADDGVATGEVWPATRIGETVVDTRTF